MLSISKTKQEINKMPAARGSTKKRTTTKKTVQPAWKQSKWKKFAPLILIMLVMGGFGVWKLVDTFAATSPALLIKESNGNGAKITAVNYDSVSNSTSRSQIAAYPAKDVAHVVYSPDYTTAAWIETRYSDYTSSIILYNASTKNKRSIALPASLTAVDGLQFTGSGKKLVFSAEDLNATAAQKNKIMFVNISGEPVFKKIYSQAKYFYETKTSYSVFSDNMIALRRENVVLKAAVVANPTFAAMGSVATCENGVGEFDSVPLKNSISYLCRTADKSTKLLTLSATGITSEVYKTVASAVNERKAISDYDWDRAGDSVTILNYLDKDVAKTCFNNTAFSISRSTTLDIVDKGALQNAYNSGYGEAKCLGSKGATGMSRSYKVGWNSDKTAIALLQNEGDLSKVLIKNLNSGAINTVLSSNYQEVTW